MLMGRLVSLWKRLLGLWPSLEKKTRRFAVVVATRTCVLSAHPKKTSWTIVNFFVLLRQLEGREEERLRCRKLQCGIYKEPLSLGLMLALCRV